MENARYPLLFNPSARSQRGRAALRFLMSRAANFALYATRGSEDAEALAASFAAAGEKIVIASGGDGTINAVVRGLAGSQTALGIIPTGTMNVFARELGLPFDNLKRCLEVIQSENIREIDLFEANGIPFVQMAGIGFDAQVIEETSWESKKVLGPLAYLLAAVRVLGAEPPKLKVELDTGQVLDAACVLIGNGSLYGGQLKLFGMANNADDFLDLLIYEEAGYKAFFNSIRGAALNDVNVLTNTANYVQTRWAKVTSDRPVPVEVDGEFMDKVTEIEFKPAVRKLRVVAPDERIGSRIEGAIRTLKNFPKKFTGNEMA